MYRVYVQETAFGAPWRWIVTYGPKDRIVAEGLAPTEAAAMDAGEAAADRLENPPPPPPDRQGRLFEEVC